MRRIVLAVTALAMSVIMSMTAFAGTWFQDKWGLWYYRNDDGSVSSNEWVETSGKWYYTGTDGRMVERCIVDGYYIGKDGAWDSSITIKPYTVMNEDIKNKYKKCVGRRGVEAIYSLADITGDGIPELFCKVGIPSAGQTIAGESDFVTDVYTYSSGKTTFLGTTVGVHGWYCIDKDGNMYFMTCQSGYAGAFKFGISSDGKKITDDNINLDTSDCMDDEMTYFIDPYKYMDKAGLYSAESYGEGEGVLWE